MMDHPRMVHDFLWIILGWSMIPEIVQTNSLGGMYQLEQELVYAYTKLKTNINFYINFLVNFYLINYIFNDVYFIFLIYLYIITIEISI